MLTSLARMMHDTKHSCSKTVVGVPATTLPQRNRQNPYSDTSEDRAAESTALWVSLSRMT